MSYFYFLKIKRSVGFRIGVLLFGWYILFSIVGYIALIKLRNTGLNASDYSTSIFYSPWLGSDTTYYLRIAQYGYGNGASGLHAFFPLFPLSIFTIHHVFQISYYASAMFICIAAMFFATYSLYYLALDYSNDEKQSWKSVYIFISFPFAYFFHSFYSESLFCCILFLAIRAMRKKNWYIAALLVGIGTSVRLVGILLIPVFIYEIFKNENFAVTKKRHLLASFFLLPLGILFYMFFLFSMYHDPLLFFHVYAKHWTYQKLTFNVYQTFTTQITIILYSLLHMQKTTSKISLINSMLFFMPWLFSFFMLLKSIKKLPLSYSFYIALTLIFLVFSGNFISDNRYILTLFPIYILLPEYFQSEEAFYGWIIFSSIFCSLFYILLINGFWTG